MTLPLRVPGQSTQPPHTLTQLVKLPIFKLSWTASSRENILRKLPFLKEVSRLQQLRKKKKIKAPPLMSLIFTKKMDSIKRRVYIFLYLKQFLGFIFSNAYFVWLTLQAGQIRSARRARACWPPFHRVTASQMTSHPVKAKEGKRKEQEESEKERKGREPWSVGKDCLEIQASQVHCLRDLEEQKKWIKAACEGSVHHDM